MRPVLLLVFLLSATSALAQGMDGMDHSQMDHGAMIQGAMSHEMPAALGPYAMTREASGTSWQPQAAPHAGITLSADDWMVMLHGRVAGIWDRQSGPRGDTQIFAPGMAMASATRALSASDTLSLRGMVSLDPFMGRRGYPLLLASGETADGVTHLVDRQHPHDLVMELSASGSHRFDETSSIFLYGGYPGEPALGPSAYMHRVSGLDIPETPISHHGMDATHISFGVVTLGLVQGRWKAEVSRFTGREPDQFRFNFDAARFDSTSARLSFNPDENWSLQASLGFLRSPEQLAPSDNENRATISATYFRALGAGSIAATLAFGRKRLSGGEGQNAVLAEAAFKPDAAWTLFTRAEHIQSEELVPGHALHGAAKLSLGAVHDWRLAEHFKVGLGGLYAWSFPPGGAYGPSPGGTMAFVRLIAE